MKLCVIPARGGSKRIPRKNIRDFCGRPILAYSIAAARACGLFDRVMVSTDDAEIAEVARRHGAEIPFLRPAELADDFTGTNAVVKQAIQWHQAQGMAVEAACCLYATAPFVTARDLAAAWEMLETGGRAYVFSVARFAYPIQRALRRLPDGSVEMFQPQHRMTRSQDLEPAYHDAGQFYWGRAQAFLDDLPIFAPHSLAYLLPAHRVQDIDTEEDWQRAERMYRLLQMEGAV
ncbi:MAG: pseudaminic acid cytidylyltransferase [Methylophilaceae bacterium]|nr:pseudaminic acid cytidylyltransferase [Methylophilaceae bacterium]